MTMSDAAIDRYAVIGYPVQHSWSPFIHGMFAKQTGQTHELHAHGGRRRKISNATSGRSSPAGGKGLNITVPHKQAACMLVTRYRTPRAEIARRSEHARCAGATACSATTPTAPGWSPISRAISDSSSPTRASCCSAPAARRAACSARCSAQARSTSKSPIATRRARRELARRVLDARQRAWLRLRRRSAAASFDLVINATSASLQDRFRPIPPAAIGPATLCYDMAYGKGDTAFTRWAKSAGAGRAETGWGMLVEQAAEVVPALARHASRTRSRCSKR